MIDAGILMWILGALDLSSEGMSTYTPTLAIIEPYSLSIIQYGFDRQPASHNSQHMSYQPAT
jgi:hypothetical protein